MIIMKLIHLAFLLSTFARVKGIPIEERQSCNLEEAIELGENSTVDAILEKRQIQYAQGVSSKLLIVIHLPTVNYIAQRSTC